MTIDRHPAYPGVRSVTLRSDAGRVGPRLLETVAAPEALVGVAVDEQELLRAPERYAGFARRLTVVVERDRAMGLVREAATLRRLGAFVELAPAALGDGGVLMMLASLGVPVGVGLAPVLDAARLEPITRYFLRSPTLESPIEPLHLVATALGGDGRRGPTITGFYRTIPGRHLHVTAERRVSLSRALAAQGLFLGDLDGGEESWRGSPLWRQASAFPERVFAELQVCAFCPHWRYCRGCYRLPDAAPDACAPWRAAFDEVRAAGHELTASAAAAAPGADASG